MIPAAANDSMTAAAILRMQVIAEARACLGSPWVHQGRCPGIGLDCVGLLVVIAQRLGIPYVDLRAYPRDPNGLLVPTLRQSLHELASPNDAQPGDVVVFRIRREPQHVALLADRPRGRAGEMNMIHSLRDNPVARVVEHVYDEAWRRRAVHAFAWSGVSQPEGKANG